MKLVSFNKQNLDRQNRNQSHLCFINFIYCKEKCLCLEDIVS